MDLLKVTNGKITDASGKEVWLRGTAVGGWMNMEDFINGYPGTESGIRGHMRRVLGENTGRYFFEKMLDNFFDEDDVAFIAKAGANCVRLSLNHRHFEDDAQPFVYKEEGFARLKRIVDICERHGLYVILDMHTVPGWQNCHWHCDNERGASLFWTHLHFQDRLAGLWKELAHRYKGRSVIAAYDLMNEPSSGNPNGEHGFDFYENYRSDWEAINRIYRRMVEAIRTEDPDHIIFLEGDRYAHLFDGMEHLTDPNIAYSIHSYVTPGFGPGKYPGYYSGRGGDVYWDKNYQRRLLLGDEGVRFAQKHNAPIWVGEFGSQYHGPEEELPDRLRSMEDQLSLYNEHGMHWTTWTYKDMGVMGWVTVDPESDYAKIVAPVQKMKRTLGAENFVALYGEPAQGRVKSRELADLILKVSGNNIHPDSNAYTLQYAALTGFAAANLQPAYANRFKHMKEGEIDRVLDAFLLKNCIVNKDYMTLLKKLF